MRLHISSKEVKAHLGNKDMFLKWFIWLRGLGNHRYFEHVAFVNSCEMQWQGSRQKFSGDSRKWALFILISQLMLFKGDFTLLLVYYNLYFFVVMKVEKVNLCKQRKTKNMKFWDFRAASPLNLHLLIMQNCANPNCNSNIHTFTIREDMR